MAGPFRHSGWRQGRIGFAIDDQEAVTEPGTHTHTQVPLRISQSAQGQCTDAAPSLQTDRFCCVGWQLIWVAASTASWSSPAGLTYSASAISRKIALRAVCVSRQARKTSSGRAAAISSQGKRWRSRVDGSRITVYPYTTGCNLHHARCAGFAGGVLSCGANGRCG